MSLNFEENVKFFGVSTIHMDKNMWKRLIEFSFPIHEWERMLNIRDSTTYVHGKEYCCVNWRGLKVSRYNYRLYWGQWNDITKIVVPRNRHSMDNNGIIGSQINVSLMLYLARYAHQHAYVHYCASTWHEPCLTKWVIGAWNENTCTCSKIVQWKFKHWNCALLSIWVLRR